MAFYIWDSTSQIFEKIVYKDEKIIPPSDEATNSLPEILQKAREIEKKNYSSTQIFLRQGKLLADYEDDYEYDKRVVRFYPTYQQLDNREFRAYFGWRAKVRKGMQAPDSPGFRYLYINEIINQIGVKDSLDGYHKLKEFKSLFPHAASYILDDILKDYVVYYNLPAELLPDKSDFNFINSIDIISTAAQQEPDTVIQALKRISPKWLGRSKFYSEYKDDMNEVIFHTLIRMIMHYDKKCSRSLIDAYFGPMLRYQIRLFPNLVFCNPLKRKDYSYELSSQWKYEKVNQTWIVTKRMDNSRAESMFTHLFKNIDYEMRKRYGYKFPIKPEKSPKWLSSIISSEIEAVLERQAAALAEAQKLAPIPIDTGKLAKIREDALVTQEKLIVEEIPDISEQELPEITSDHDVNSLVANKDDAENSNNPLSDDEKRLLKCLLKGDKLDWVSKKGLLLSVLVDEINDKLFDIFGDSVLNDSPELLEEYREDVKEFANP